MSTTSSVMANPNTPSLNPSIRSLLRTRRPRGASASADMACLLRADGQAVAIFNLGRLWIAPVTLPLTIAHESLGEPGHGVAHPGTTAATEGRELQVNRLFC